MTPSSTPATPPERSSTVEKPRERCSGAVASSGASTAQRSPRSPSPTVVKRRVELIGLEMAPETAKAHHAVATGRSDTRAPARKRFKWPRQTHCPHGQPLSSVWRMSSSLYCGIRRISRAFLESIKGYWKPFSIEVEEPQRRDDETPNGICCTGSACHKQRIEASPPGVPFFVSWGSSFHNADIAFVIVGNWLATHRYRVPSLALGSVLRATTEYSGARSPSSVIYALIDLAPHRCKTPCAPPTPPLVSTLEPRVPRGRRAQSTVEAAFLLPTFLTLVLLALQPVCLLYTRAVMESAAAETARLMTTTTVGDDEDIKEFARRRLAAVPDISIFHAGGPLSWDIELGRADAGGASSVSVTGEVKPLPVIGAFAQAMGSAGQNGYVELRVDVSYRSRPEWLEGDYDSWIAAWD